MKEKLNLICPRCHSPLGVKVDLPKHCHDCKLELHKIHEVPVLRCFNSTETIENIDFLESSANLSVMNSATLKIPFIQEALSSGKLVLEIGAGVDICENSNLVKTDAYLYSNNLDYIVDAHEMPFPDNTFDYVYSLAVFEHLQTPWLAASEILRVLKPGGKVYVLSAFNQHIHGYPHHYFNMTDMGLRRIFENYEDVQCSPSPYCPISQISFSLLDLLKMIKSLQTREPSQDCNNLYNATEAVVNLLPKYETKLIEGEDIFEYWRNIAPGFDLYATKPLAESNSSGAEIINLKRLLARSQERVKAMESSKFWKLRKMWLRVKSTLGLKTDE